MCIDDGCDELICCICAPLAAILCCKVCKDRTGPNNNQSSPNSFYPQPDDRVPAAGVYGPQGYGPPALQQAQFYPGGSQPRYPPPNQPIQGNYFPPQQGYSGDGGGGLPPGYIKRQPTRYQQISTNMYNH